jgi:hypothetical protein
MLVRHSLALTWVQHPHQLTTHQSTNFSIFFPSFTEFTGAVQRLVTSFPAHLTLFENFYNVLQLFPESPRTASSGSEQGTHANFQSNAQGGRTKNPKNQNFFYSLTDNNLRALSASGETLFSHQTRKSLQ